MWLSGVQPPKELRLSKRAEAQVRAFKEWAKQKARAPSVWS